MKRSTTDSPTRNVSRLRNQWRRTGTALNAGRITLQINAVGTPVVGIRLLVNNESNDERELGKCSRVGTVERVISTFDFSKKVKTMAPRSTVEDGNAASEESPEEQPKPVEEPTAQSEPPKKRIQIRDATGENPGMSYAFIGGVRAPKPPLK